MTPASSIAVASPNIALIKYWGNYDDSLRLPANDSLSFTLSDLETRTRVTFASGYERDHLILNGVEADEYSLERATRLLDQVRRLSGHTGFATIDSENNFPTGAGIASSASAFAALALAAASATGLNLDDRALSRLARLGSGSSARSVFGGFALLHAGDNDESCYAEQLFPADHWPVVDLIAVVEPAAKSVGSTNGHQRSASSPLQKARVADTPRRLGMAMRALETHDFEALAEISEMDSNMMHAIMLTSSPPLIYWSPGSVALMLAVQQWRKAGDPVFFTLDAGPNVHCITLPVFANELKVRLEDDPWVKQVLVAPIGVGSRLIPE